MAQLKKKETREIPEVIMVENFLNTKTTDPVSSEDIKQDKQQNEKQNPKAAPRHLIFKLQKKKKIQDRENPEATSKQQIAPYLQRSKNNNIATTVSNLSSETMQATESEILKH